MSLRLETEMKVSIVKWYYENIKSVVRTQRTFKRVYKCKTAPCGQESGILLRNSRKMVQLPTNQHQVQYSLQEHPITFQKSKDDFKEDENIKVNGQEDPCG